MSWSEGYIMFDDYLIYTIFTMFVIFFVSLIGIGLVLEIVSSSLGLPGVGISVGVLIGLCVDYSIYRSYIDDRLYMVIGE